MSEHGLPRTGAEQQRAQRAVWAETAEPRICEGCATAYQPTHPRQKFCKDPACPGRRARRRGRGDLPAAARRRGVQGVLADVLLHTHHAEPDGSIGEVRAAVEAWVAAERTRRPREVHAALVRLQATCAVRTARVSPPDDAPSP